MKGISLIFALCLFSVLSFAQAIKVTSEGRVGIGLADPAQKLDVNGDIGIRGDQLSLGYLTTSKTVAIAVGKQRKSAGESALDLYADENEDFGARFIREAGGNTNLIHRGNGSLRIEAVDRGSISFHTYQREHMRITPDGNVGIGTSFPESILSVNGSAHKPGGGDWAMLSDMRFQKDVEPYDKGLEEVLQLNPVSWIYNGKGNISDTRTRFVGVVAQEIQEVAPEMVREIPVTTEFVRGGTERKTESFTDRVLSIDATAIRYMLVNAIKQQQEMIEEQNIKIRELEQKINSSGDLQAISSRVVVLGQEDQLELQQNRPNPFSTTTTIEYKIPSGVEDPYLEIIDQQGRIIQRIILEEGTGINEIILKRGGIPSGQYTYSLIENKTVLQTKKMTVVD